MFLGLSPHPQAASFIRPTRPTDPCRSFLSAIREKYASTSVVKSSLESRPISIGGKVVEEVGFEKIRRQLAVTQDLRIVLVDGLCIAGVLPAPYPDVENGLDWREGVKSIQQVCPRIQELDLSRNLLEKIVDVAGICSALCDLKSLKLKYFYQHGESRWLIILSGNRIRDLSSGAMIPKDIQTSFSSITELHLDSTLFDWPQLMSILEFFSSILTLSLATNHLKTLPIILPNANLTHLSLSHNEVSSLEDLHSLTVLPHLVTLLLPHNYLVKLIPAPVFPVVETLSLAHNLLPALSVLTTLPSSFPCLKSLLTTANPFHSTMDSTAIYTLTIARIPTLETLNHTRITSADRLNADLYYLSRIERELSAAPSSSEQTILAAHPRYSDLCAQYGTPTIHRPR